MRLADHRGILLTILILALVIRLGWVLSRPVDDASALRSLPDQREYLELGRNLWAQHRLVFHDDRIDADVYAFRTPGYPLFIAMLGGNVRAIRIGQALLDAATVVATYLLARRWLSSLGSVIAASLIAFNPFLIYFTGLILSETLFIAMLAWGITLLSFNRHWSWIALLLLALSALVRPSAIGLIPLLAYVSALTNQPQQPAYKSHRRAILLASASIGLTIVCLFPWALRNHRVLGTWVWTSTNSGVTLYDGFNPAATGASDQRFVMGMSQLLRPMGEVERSRYLTNLAKRFVQEEPKLATRLALVKIARTWSPVPLSREYGGNTALISISIAYTVPLFAFVILGLFSKNPLSPAAKVFLALPAIYITLVHALSVGSLRYRLPADVPMAVIAAAAVVTKIEQRPRRSAPGLLHE